MGPILSVVYFDQLLGAAHAKRWSKYQLSLYPLWNTLGQIFFIIMFELFNILHAPLLGLIGRPGEEEQIK